MLTRTSGISRMRFFTIANLRVTGKRCCHLSARSTGRRPVRLCRSLLYIFARRLSTSFRVFTFCQRNLGHRFQRKVAFTLSDTDAIYRCRRSHRDTLQFAFRIREPEKENDAGWLKREAQCCKWKTEMFHSRDWKTITITFFYEINWRVGVFIIIRLHISNKI